ncbi:hypothetical protein QUW40_02765 [Collinsella tanakaei]|uniref:hypothetical protein n=1 Tax=Collinsella tanakaei TaxID=626935 RepID=UPI0025A39160|nr:hypothetical protein [Collinsella tanakaei]MDM8245516.1 hypothetical protein [Collinsella tanakaei]
MSHEESGDDLLQSVAHCAHRVTEHPLRIRKASCIVLAIILCVQLAVCSWFAVHKLGLFQDESYTFFLANGDWLNAVPEEGVIYKQGDPWGEWASVDSFLGVDFEMLYKNQASDNHPPLYYTLFSLAYSLFPGSVNPIIGVGLNIVFALITTIELYFLGKMLGLPKSAGLLVCGLWAVNPGMINCMLYLRMYQLLAVFFLGSALAALSFLKSERIHLGNVLAVFLTTVGGFLTQYFFVFFAFVLYLCVGITLLARRRVGNAALFAVSGIGGVAAGILLFPPSIDHLFSSFRGQEALERAASGDSFGAYLVEDFRLLNSGVFGYLLPFVLVLALCFALVAVFRNRASAMIETEHLAPVAYESSGIWWLGVAILAISSLFYIVIVARVAPYASIRYLMAVNAVLMVWPYSCVLGALNRLLPKKRVVALGVVAVLGVAATASGYMQGIKYFDQHNESVAELAQRNDAMVALWGDKLLQEAIFQDAMCYDKSVYFSNIDSFGSFEFESLGHDFSLYVQHWMDVDPYIELLESQWGARVTYVGDNVDSSYAVYDVHID